jgi:acyl-coenzyme A thioesterase PaaI-like protein
MDYEALRAGLGQVVPFNTRVGLQVLDVSDGTARVRLPDAAHLLNHVESQHAAALFAAGEAASGAAVVGAFARHLGTVTPLARSADIRYLKIAHGSIIATGRLTEPTSEVVVSEPPC